MNKYSLNHRTFIVLTFHKTECLTETVKLFKKEFGNHHNISKSTIKPAYDKLLATKSVWDDVDSMKSKEKSVRREEIIEKVREFFEESPSTSEIQASRVLNISKTSIHRILTIDIGIFPYKIQVNQPISEKARLTRFKFANKMISMIESQQMDFSRIWFSDEAHFDLQGYVNKQNWRFWGSENPHVSIIRPLHSVRLTVWCAISAEAIIGPVFIIQNITSEKYCNMLSENIIFYMHGTNKIDDYWFMQDGALPHRTDSVFRLLSEHFQDRIIGLDSQRKTGDGIDWPPYSPNLNPCNYFLWGNLRDKVYKTQPETLEDLKLAIEMEIKEIGPDILRKTIGNFEDRLRHVLTTERKHFKNLLY